MTISVEEAKTADPTLSLYQLLDPEVERSPATGKGHVVEKGRRAEGLPGQQG